MFVLVPNLRVLHTNYKRQPPKYRALQISFDGLGSQGKSGDWQLVFCLLTMDLEWGGSKLVIFIQLFTSSGFNLDMTLIYACFWGNFVP